jgi:hypothetical protein
MDARHLRLRGQTEVPFQLVVTDRFTADCYLGSRQH